MPTYLWKGHGKQPSGKFPVVQLQACSPSAAVAIIQDVFTLDVSLVFRSLLPSILGIKKELLYSSPLPFNQHENLPSQSDSLQATHWQGRNKKLYLLCYVTTSQAAGAHLDSHGGSTDLSLYLNKVWLPSTACMIIWLTHFITTQRTLSTNFASSGHNKPAYKISEAT